MLLQKGRVKRHANFSPKYEVGTNIVTGGETDFVRKKRASLKGGSLELRIAGSMKKI